MKNHSGFSLLELSIVLVIIGLIAGGIVAGSSMIRAAELRSVITEYDKIKTATYLFKDKYFGLPGDLKNATVFWGDNTTHCADAAVADGTPGVCNGDGDGVVVQEAAADGEEAEGYMYWLHLSEAGLISGTYTGISGPLHEHDDVLGENVYTSKLDGGGWNISSNGSGMTWSTNVNYLAHRGKFYFEFGANDSGDEDTDAPIMTPEEGWNIDKKMDDGIPSTGQMLARNWNNLCGMANDGSHAADDLDASYKLSDTSVQCSFDFIPNF